MAHVEVAVSWIRRRLRPSRITIASITAVVTLAVSIFTLAQILGWWQQQPPFDHPRLEQDFTAIQEDIGKLDGTRKRSEAQIQGVSHRTIKLHAAATELAAIDVIRRQIIGDLLAVNHSKGNANRFATKLASIADLERRTGEAYSRCFARGHSACAIGDRLRDKQADLKDDFVTKYNTYIRATRTLVNILPINSGEL